MIRQLIAQLIARLRTRKGHGGHTPSEPALASVAQHAAPSRVPESVVRSDAPVPGNPAPRYAVLRRAHGITHGAYIGNDGTRAAEAWEAYHECDLAGVFTFTDRRHRGGVGNRGHFER